MERSHLAAPAAGFEIATWAEQPQCRLQCLARHNLHWIRQALGQPASLIDPRLCGAAFVRIRIRIIKASPVAPYGEPWLHLLWSFSTSLCKFADFRPRISVRQSLLAAAR